MQNFEFTNNWFEFTAKKVWDEYLPLIKPTKILEVGSYEGASACYLIQNLASVTPIEIHCVDTWEGSIEHQAGGNAEVNMTEVEQRFKINIALARERASHNVRLVVHKGSSDFMLCKLLADGKRSYFDFIYIDGSHQAPDVICDAVLSFRLLSVGGILIFDDYLWAEDLPYGRDPLRCPKLAIDSFTNMYARKLRLLPAPSVMQLYVQKVAD